MAQLGVTEGGSITVADFHLTPYGSVPTSISAYLAQAAVTHVWMGFVAFTFDTMPHVGERDGVYYAMGYCGQGIPSATYYGRKVGLWMAERTGADTALRGLEFPSRSFYTGRPWFLPAAVQSYRWLDRLGI